MLVKMAFFRKVEYTSSMFLQTTTVIFKASHGELWYKWLVNACFRKSFQEFSLQWNEDNNDLGNCDFPIPLGIVIPNFCIQWLEFSIGQLLRCGFTAIKRVDVLLTSDNCISQYSSKIQHMMVCSCVASSLQVPLGSTRGVQSFRSKAADLGAIT